jgi:hypothetical protein
VTAEDQIENLMLSIAKKSVLKTLCPLLPFDMQFPKLDVAGSNPVSRSNFSKTYEYQSNPLLDLCSI